MGPEKIKLLIMLQPIKIVRSFILSTAGGWIKDNFLNDLQIL